MSDYVPWDQGEKLPPPPWSPDDPDVRAWEQAHGHDVRLKCYVEFGCQVIEPALEARIEQLEGRIEQLLAEREAVRACIGAEVWDACLAD